MQCWLEIENQMTEMSNLTPDNTVGLHFRSGVPKRLLFALKNANERYQICRVLTNFFFTFWEISLSQNEAIVSKIRMYKIGTVNRGNFGHQGKFGQPPNFSLFSFIFMRLSKYPLTAEFLVISRLYLMRIIRYFSQKMFCYLILVSQSDVIFLKLVKFWAGQNNTKKIRMTSMYFFSWPLDPSRTEKPTSNVMFWDFQNREKSP